MNSTDYKFIRKQNENNICYIRLHRPELKNALNFDIFYELKSAFEAADIDETIKLIVLAGYTSDEQNFFSSGIDLNELKQLQTQIESKDQLAQTIDGLQDCVATIEFVEKPVIAVVNQFCFGSALELALACDFIIASPGTKFGLLETKYGIIPDLGGTYRLIRRIGYQHAKRMIILSSIHTAAELRENNIDLVDWVVDIPLQDQFINELVAQILANDYQAVIAAKRLSRNISPIKHKDASELEKDAQLHLLMKK